MSQTRLLEVARQGDPRAISTLLNAVLLPKRVKAEVTRQECTLTITLHSEKMLNQGAAVTLIRTALEKLNLPDIDQVVIESRVLGAPLWDVEFGLRSPVEETSQALETPTPAVELSPANPSSAIPDPWQNTPDPALSETPDQSEAETVAHSQDTQETPEPVAPPTMDVMAASVESTVPDAIEPPPVTETTSPEEMATTSNEDVSLSDLGASLNPEVPPKAAPNVATAAKDTATIPTEHPLASALPELEPVDTSAIDTDLPESRESPITYPPPGDPWLEVDPHPLPAAVNSAAAAAAAPETLQSSTNETTEYTTPTLEKVARDSQLKVAGVIGIVMGLGFCATGLGIVIGLPMIVGGVWLLGDEEVWRGECPHCRQTLKVPSKLSQSRCPRCQGLIAIKQGRFYARRQPHSSTATANS